MSSVEHLRRALMKTGYPLEIEVSSVLDKDWEGVINTDTYYDRDESKLRDIDILAYKNLAIKTQPLLSTFVSLAVECKKDENFAWVFFSRPLKFSFEDIDGQYVDQTQMASNNFENLQVMEMILGKCPLHYENMKRKAVTYDAVYIKGNKNSYEGKKREIFEAQNQLKKYIDYSIEQLTKADLRGGHVIQNYFPCIVFDGRMYEAIVESGDLSLRESDHLVLATSYKSQYSVWERNLLIDIVRKNYLETYLDLIQKDISSLKKTISKKSKSIFRRIDEIVDLLTTTRVKTQ
jgi:hypothetical protein